MRKDAGVAELLSRIEKLEDALRPFAEEGNRWIKSDSLDDSVFATAPNDYVIRVPFTVGKFREALEALEGET